MGVVDGLLANKGFIIQSLLSLISEERGRIIDGGLIKQASCDLYLHSFLTKIANDANNITEDQIISKLTNLYDAMNNVRLFGDKFFEEEEIRNHNVSPVVEQVMPKVANKQEYSKIVDFVSDSLEKIAFSLGSSGNHKMAFEVERAIKNIKAGE